MPNKRSSHCLPTPRGGGIGLLLSLIIVVYTTPIPLSFWGPAVALALLGLYDDIHGISARIKLSVQFFATAVFVGGILLSPPSSGGLLLFPAWLLFVVGTTNFYNFMDGINGIAGLSGVVAFSLLAVFIRLNLPESHFSLVVAVAVVAACVGFLPFNMPRATIFMGDTGSILLGFLFSAMVVSLSSNLSDFLCLSSFLFLFYADGLSTLYLRWRDGEPLTHAHRRHLYQILGNELRLPHWQISCGYALLQCLVAMVMLLLFRQGLFWQTGWLMTCSVLFIFSSQKIRGNASQNH